MRATGMMVGAILLLGPGCGRIGFESGSEGELVIDRVVPSTAPNGASTPIRIEGSGFDRPAGEGFRVVVGTTSLADVAWRGESLIEATVPAGIAPGRYDISVTLGDRTSMLPGGFEVVALACTASYPITIPSAAGSRYRFGGAHDWLTAELGCAAEGAHLAVIENDVERSELHAIDGNNLWIGVTDRVTEGAYRLVTGPGATYLPWDNGEPSGASADCAELGVTGLWNDEPCTVVQGYVCECDGVGEDPTAY